MRILLINPNTTEAMTARMLAAARLFAAPGTVLDAVTAERGVPYIASRAEAQIGGAIAIEMLAEHQHRADAAIIAAFGDPGLFGAREVSDIPVVGMAEAAMLTACMLGRRFAIVTFSRALGPWFEDCVEMHGLSGRCVGVRMLGGAIENVSDVQDEKEEHLVALACRTVEETGADVIVLAGAPLAGLADRIKSRVPVPVIDQIAAAVKQAETLVTLGIERPRAGGFRRPEAKPTIGLPEPLAALIEHRERRS
ncbi:MAG TPA: aspartate/glutamate racemase family protein [Methylomirabilota bacterium]|nr:aspartate/glutamate racemase family protein [Methylomirabilota bacterium]